MNSNTKKSFYIFYSFLVLILCMGSRTFAQSTVVSGTVTDSKDKSPLPSVTILFKDTKIAVRTDADGKFSISGRAAYTQLQVIYVGYKTKFVHIIPSTTQTINIVLQEESQNLHEVTISSKAKKVPYRNKGNPAVELIRKVIENKSLNRLESEDAVEYKQYDWMQFSMSNLSDQFKNKKIFKHYQFLFDKQDSTEIGGKNIMPIYLRERLSQNYFRKDPKKNKTIMLADKHVKFEEGMIDNNALGNYFERMYADVDIYKNNIVFTNSQFLSPIAESAPLFYKFFITDTVKNQTPNLIELSFVPRNQNALLFEGQIYITMDGKYAVQDAFLKTGKNVNVNFVKALEVKLDFEKDTAGKYHMSKSHLVMDFGLGKDGGKGFKGERTVTIKDYKTNIIRPDSVYRGLDLEVVPEAEKRSAAYWASNRLDTISAEKLKIYGNIDSLGKMKSFKRMMDIVAFFFVGYKQYGPVEIGPFYTFYTFNSLEGFKPRIGGRTTTDFSTRFYFDTYAAYGVKDEKWKYYFSGAYAFNNKSIYTFPQSFVRASFQRDVNVPGDMSKNIVFEDNFLASFKHGETSQFLYSDLYKAEYMQEYANHFSFNLGFTKWTQRPAGSLTFTTNENNLPVNVDQITSSELSLQLRYAPHERFYQGKVFRERLIEKYPVFYLNYSQGIKGLFNGEYNYKNLMGYIDKRFYMSQFGRSDVRLEGGYILGNVPFALLDIHRANQSYAYQTYAYNMMNFMEFVSDHYVSLNIDHNFNGLFVNRIPLIKHLKLREYITFKGLYGGLRAENNPDLHSDLPQFPVNAAGIPTTYVLGKLPYMEGSVGIGNIFRVIRLDLVRRFNYLDHPGISKYGVRAKLQFEF
jgi:hypothetical protein